MATCWLHRSSAVVAAAAVEEEVDDVAVVVVVWISEEAEGGVDSEKATVFVTGAARSELLYTLRKIWENTCFETSVIFFLL